MNELVKEPQPRTCENCACYHVQVNPQTPELVQGFCRRSPPQYREATVEIPRLDDKGKIVLGRDGTPLMEKQKQAFFLYPPTLSMLVCFDGWRAAGELPGSPRHFDELLKMGTTWLTEHASIFNESLKLFAKPSWPSNTPKPF